MGGSNFKDLKGRKIGNLTVLERGEDYFTPQGLSRVQWLCRCDCGNTKLISAANLLRGYTTTCGCKMNSHSGGFVDLTGQKFGSLTVLERGEDYHKASGSREPQWVCECDCGNRKLVMGRYLKQGKVTSCGCVKSERRSGFIDLTGQTFGKLTVLCQDHSEKHRKAIRWRCRCQCGRETVVTGSDLRSGNTQSCGQCKYENKYEFFPDHVVGYTNTGATFIIDPDDYEKISQYYWRVDNRHGYVETFIKDHKRLTLHRLIMDAEKGEIIDHINHDKTDNRKTNLRKVSDVQSSVNRKLRSDNTSGHRGVCYHKGRGRKHWRASITVNKEVIALGNYLTFEEAVAARQAAEEKYFGEYSYENSLAAVPAVDSEKRKQMNRRPDPCAYLPDHLPISLQNSPFYASQNPLYSYYYELIIPVPDGNIGLPRKGAITKAIIRVITKPSRRSVQAVLR